MGLRERNRDYAPAMSGIPHDKRRGLPDDPHDAHKLRRASSVQSYATAMVGSLCHDRMGGKQMGKSSNMEPFVVKDCTLVAIATGRRAQNLRELRDQLQIVHPGSIYYH